MCGIAGIVGRGHVNQQLYDALTVLQHRGQDAAGIVTCDNGVFKQRKANGLVRDDGIKSVRDTFKSGVEAGMREPRDPPERQRRGA